MPRYNTAGQHLVPTPPKPQNLRYNIHESVAGDTAARDVALAAWKPDDSMVVDVVGSRVSVALTRAANNVQDALRAAADAAPFVPRSHRLAFCLLGQQDTLPSPASTSVAPPPVSPKAEPARKGVKVEYGEPGTPDGYGLKKSHRNKFLKEMRRQEAERAAHAALHGAPMASTSQVPPRSASDAGEGATSKEVFQQFLRANTGYISLRGRKDKPSHFLCVCGARPSTSVITTPDGFPLSMCVITPLLPLEAMCLDVRIASWPHSFGSPLGWEPDLCISGNLQDTVRSLMPPLVAETQSASLPELRNRLRSSMSATSQCTLVKHGQGAFLHSL